MRLHNIQAPHISASRLFSSTTKYESHVESSLGLELQNELTEPDCEAFEEDWELKNVAIASILHVSSRCWGSALLFWTKCCSTFTFQIKRFVVQLAMSFYFICNAGNPSIVFWINKPTILKCWFRVLRSRHYLTLKTQAYLSVSS